MIDRHFLGGLLSGLCLAVGLALAMSYCGGCSPVYGLMAYSHAFPYGVEALERDKAELAHERAVAVERRKAGYVVGDSP